MRSLALREDLDEGLEQRGLVRRFEPVVDRDRRLQHAGAGLLVQGLQREAHLLAQVQRLEIVLGVHRVADHRVAEEAGRDRLETAVVLRAHRVRRLVEHEVLVLEARVDLEAQRARLVDHPAQQAARAGHVALLDELGEEEQHAGFERNVAAGLGQDAHGRVRIAGVPAGVLHVVVELVVGIPAQHHVAEAEALVERAEELLARHVLAAQDAVDVEHADLDVGEAALLDDLPGVGDGLDVFGSHGWLGRSWRWSRMLAHLQPGPTLACIIREGAPGEARYRTVRFTHHPVTLRVPPLLEKEGSCFFGRPR